MSGNATPVSRHQGGTRVINVTSHETSPQAFRDPLASRTTSPSTTPPRKAPSAVAATSTPVTFAENGQARVYSQPPRRPPTTPATLYQGSGSGGGGTGHHHFRGHGVPHQPTSAQSAKTIAVSL